MKTKIGFVAVLTMAALLSLKQVAFAQEKPLTCSLSAYTTTTDLPVVAKADGGRGVDADGYGYFFTADTSEMRTLSNSAVAVKYAAPGLRHVFVISVGGDIALCGQLYVEPKAPSIPTRNNTPAREDLPTRAPQVMQDVTTSLSQLRQEVTNRYKLDSAPAVLGLEPVGSELAPFFQTYAALEPGVVLFVAEDAGNLIEVAAKKFSQQLPAGFRVSLKSAIEGLQGRGTLTVYYAPDTGGYATLKQNVSFPLDGPQTAPAGQLRLYGNGRIPLIRLVNGYSAGFTAAYPFQIAGTDIKDPLVVFGGRLITPLRYGVDFAAVTGLYADRLYLGTRELNPTLTPRGVVTVKVGEVCASTYLELLVSDLSFDRQ